jgi:spermidine synthase
MGAGATTKGWFSPGAWRRVALSPSNIEILASAESALGMLCLRQRELLSEPGTMVTEITLDHEFLMSSYSTASERALARCALDMHAGRGLKVLVGGLGLGYTAHEVLASDRVGRVEVVELLPPVIDWLDRGLVPLSDALKADLRFAVNEGDVYRMLSMPPGRKYDLILVDVDHSPDERLGNANDSFYSKDGLKLAKKHLRAGGVLGVWSYTESSPFSEALRGVFSEVRIESVTFQNQLVGEEERDWLFFGRG